MSSFPPPPLPSYGKFLSPIFFYLLILRWWTNSITRMKLSHPLLKIRMYYRLCHLPGLVSLDSFYVKSPYISVHVTLSLRVVSLPLLPNGSMTAM